MSLFGNLGENLAGAWLVMCGRAEGLNRLDLSLEGFWRSFAAILLIVPFALVGLISQRNFVQEEGEAAGALTESGLGLEAVALLGDWLTFPLIFAAVARPLGLAARYVPFIVARNWASVIITAMVSMIHAGHIVGIVSAELASLLLFLAVAVALRFSYVIARTTLAVPFTVAVPIVLLDLLISLTVSSVFDQLGSGGP